METFVLYYRHQVGHKHFIVVQLQPNEILESETPSQAARRIASRHLPNIFQPVYLEGLYFVEFKEIT